MSGQRGFEAGLEPYQAGIPGLLRITTERPVSLCRNVQGTLYMHGRGQKRRQRLGHCLAILDVQGKGHMPVPGVLVGLYPGPVVQRETATRRFNGQGLAGPLVVLPLPPRRTWRYSSPAQPVRQPPATATAETPGRP